MENKSFEELLKKSEKKEKKSKYKILLLTIIPILIGLIFSIYTINKSEKAEIVINENKNLRDSTIALNSYKDSLAQMAKRKTILRNKVTSYFKYNMEQKADSLQLLFVDTLDRYYLAEGMTKEEVKNEQLNHWKKYPNQTTEIENEYEILLEGDSLAKAFVMMKFSKNGVRTEDVLTEFRFSNGNQINFIRAFKGVPESYSGIYSNE